MRWAAALAVLALAAPARAASVEGVFALPEGAPKVTATLNYQATPPTARLEVTMRRIGQTRPITRYAVELSKRLHLIAISDDGRRFVHEHAEQPDPAGVFYLSMRFGQGGIWHVFADAVPAGLGQQVLRFDVDFGPGHSTQAARAPEPTGPEVNVGEYGVRFDRLELEAGRDNALTLHLLRGGRKARDVTPYLGVPAHAVLIGVADLSYVHVHASVGGGMEAMHHAMPAMAGPVPPDLHLDVRPPKPGLYYLWLQFMAGGAVRTVPFVVGAK